MYDEYLRRNLLVCKAVGAKSIASKSLKRLEQQTRPPKWLVAALRGILERTDPLPEDLAKWRNTASDAPEYVRAELSGKTAETPERQWLIRKHGYYYRPNRAGYTSSIAEAGRYTEKEAKSEAAIEPEVMQAVRLTKWGTPEDRVVLGHNEDDL